MRRADREWVTPMLRYVKALATIILKNPLLWVVTFLCAVMIALPAVKGDDIFSGRLLGREMLEQNDLQGMRQSLSEASKSGVPQEVQDEWREEIDLLNRTVHAESERKYAELRAELARRDIEMTRTGRLSGLTEAEYASEALFFERLAARPAPIIYENNADASATWYLSSQGSQPLIFWILPLLVAAFGAVGAAQGKRLLAQAPISPALAFLGQVFLLVLLSLLLLALVCLPVLVLQTVRAGVGDLGYPVVQLMAGEQFDQTVGSVLLRQLAAYLAVALLVSALSLVSARLFRGRAGYAGTALAVALCAMPFMSMYLEASVMNSSQLPPDASLSDPLVPYSAFTYLGEVERLAGGANYWLTQDSAQDGRLSFEGGLAVLAGWAAVAVAVGLLAIGLRHVLAVRGMRGAGGPGGRGAQSGAFSASALTLSYGRRTLLRDASLALHPGEIVGLIAPNGRGKTTLLEALVGQNTARRTGAVAAGGTPLTRTAAFRKQVLYVPCEGALIYPNLTAADHIRIAASLWLGKVDTSKLIAYCQLDGYLNRPVCAYSSGMKQQLALAVAYCTGVRYLLLDEPMNALDPGNVALNSHILKRLASDGAAVLLSSHILSNVDELCGSVIAIQDVALVRHPLNPDAVTVRAVYDDAFSTP